MKSCPASGTAALEALLPGSAVVGEEASEADPGRLAALSGEGPVWLVDPIDGTLNFVNEKPCFATIVALCIAGNTVEGWIHDPIADRTAWAARGEGAWIGGERVRATPCCWPPTRSAGKHLTV